jgi:acetyl-CoA C-acetyltransferase
MEDAVVLAGARTPIGSFLGSLSSLTAPQLGAKAIAAAIEWAGVQADQIDEVIMGCVLTGGLGQAPARQAAIYGGIPDSVPAMTINKVCGSGMKAVMLATQAIRLGDSRLVLAGGMESMSNAPYALPKARSGYRMGNGELLDLMIHDGLWDPYGNCHMGTCGDATAAEFKISRETLDAYAAESYHRARAAQLAGRFAEEIVPVEIPQRKGDPIIFADDEEPSKGDPAKLPSLRPAFDKNGVTTAGNASSINDGGCALVVSSAAYAAELGREPLGRVVGYATHAQEPAKFTTAPAYAIKKLLKQQQLSVDDIDIFEVNEAFSVVSLAVAETVGIPLKRMNVNGGAVALGHPIGMTGARLVLTALLELRRSGGRYAIATPCIGGGEATALLLERI